MLLFASQGAELAEEGTQEVSNSVTTNFLTRRARWNRSLQPRIFSYKPCIVIQHASVFTESFTFVSELAVCTASLSRLQTDTRDLA